MGLLLAGTNAKAQEEAEGGKEFKNEMTLFTGGTSNLNHHTTSFTIGLEYLHLFGKSGRLAAGVLGETIFAKHREYLAGALLYYSPVKREARSLWFWAGPGIEFIAEEFIPPDLEETKTISEFVFRIGGGYFFIVNRFNLGPTIDLDIIRNNNSIVWGINVGYEF